MKIQILLSIAAMVMPAWASASAAGWEAVFFYDAYRMESYLDESDRIIAPKCSGSAPGGRCNFIEFLHAIDSGNLSGGGTRVNPASVPGGLDLNNPDPETAAGITDWNGRPKNDGTNDRYKNYEGSYNSKVLAGEDRIKHGDLFIKLGDIMEAANKAANGVDGAKTLMGRLDSTLNSILRARITENRSNLIREINDHKTLGLAVHNPVIGEPKIVAYPIADGESAGLVDTNRLMADIENHPIKYTTDDKLKNKVRNMKRSMTKFKDNYFTDAKMSETPKSSGKTHQDTITALQSTSNKIKTCLT